MRSILAAALLVVFSASADAATMHRFRAREHAQRHLTVRPGQPVTAPARFAVPGWTDEQTREWLDYGSRGSHEG
jgi:hypothetical protein